MLRRALALRRRIPHVPNWAIGLAIATPAAAVFQGAIYLQEYRRNHADTPIPVSPSRGIVVMKSEGDSKSYQMRPLRLLVIGDSLAAGVGISKQSTPVLPESIARSLSRASGGRAVSWTCVGRPGASSTQIVQDIMSYETPNEPTLLEKNFAEWQAARYRAQEWLEKRKRLDRPTAPNVVERWWIGAQRDLSTFRSQVLVTKETQVRKLVDERRRLTKAKSVNADEYDIAVVLTGLNDLKDAFLPFLNSGANSSMSEEARKLASPDGLKGELLRMLDALKDRMRWDYSTADSQEVERTKSATIHPVNTTRTKVEKKKKCRGPLVVFPALPALAVRKFHQAPLSWFVLPLLGKVDDHKRRLADQFPEFVLYVEQPSVDVYHDIESGRGPLFANRKAEQVALVLTDVTQRAKEKVEQLMRQHYQRWTNDRDEEEAQTEPADPDVYQPCCHDHLPASDSNSPGSTLMAVDDVHPNDEGYDFWGRHIAAAIVDEWNRESKLM